MICECYTEHFASLLEPRCHLFVSPTGFKITARMIVRHLVRYL